MEHSKRLALALVLALTCPTVAQEDESTAYFSLSTQKTFAPGETPAVQMWGSGFEALEFRLYKVNDPVAFFQKLEDDHRFGGQPPPRAGRQQTALEKVRAWKQGWRGRLKNLMRAQFTRDSRVTVHAWRSEREAAAHQGASANLQAYADVPVLNSQQLVAKWEQKHESANRWDSSNVSIPTKEKGLYLVEATDGKLAAYTVVSVTDIAAITKAAPGKLITRVVRRDTGEPVRDCPIVVLTGEKKDKRAEGKTDANGVFEIAASDGDAAPQNRVVLARSGAEFAAVSMDGHQFANRASERVTAYIYTERPVYRPGHTVYYRAILRDRQDRGYQVPAPTEFNVEVQDSDGNPVVRERKTSSPMGTLSGEFKLPLSAPLGYYNIQLRLGDNTQTGGFQVEEYKKPEYEVRVTAKEARMLQGGKFEATIDARYFYGEPVAKAKVTYVVHKSRYWLPYYLDDADEESGDNDSRYADREQVVEETGQLDDEGKLTIEIPTVEAEHDLQYRIEGRVTDAAGREITGAGFVVATVGPYFLRATSDKYVYSPGDAVKVSVESRDYANRAVSNIAFTAELSAYHWRDKEFNAIATASGVTAANGSGTAQLKLPAHGGSFLIRVSSKTPNGRMVTDREYVWVSGGGEADWSGAREERIEIVADKKSYAPGDTAKVLVIAGKPNANLWVTVEGKTLYKSLYVTAKDGTANVEVPIGQEFVPNIFVNAVMVHGNELAQGSKSLKVPPDAYKLSIELTPSKPQFKPGEPGVYTLLAKDSAGKPVSAEFSVGVVDEAIYAVRPEGTPDIVNHFYGKQWSRVNTDSSLSYYFHGEAGKRRLQLATVRPYLPRAQLKPDRLVEPKVRKAFPDTAFWSANVRTDAAGKAEVKLNYPDALTTWRTTVRGISADSKVGNAINKVIVRKNLLIRLSTPRFFRQGDTMTVTAIAQNFLPAEKQVRISLEAKGLTLVEGGTKDLTVPSRGTATVDYKVKVTNVSEAVLLGKALTDEESDALELTIPVIPFGLKMSQVRGGAISNGKTSEETEITFPDAIEPTSRMLDLSVSPSAAGSLFEALEYLTSFPYGCTEQTMSSFLPNVIVSKTVQTLGLKTNLNEAVLQKQIRAGLDRLYHFHHDDGGWGWWETDASDMFMTSYVVAGLAQARSAGVKVEDARIESAVKWLKENSSKADLQPDLRAYAAYAAAIAGSPDIGALNDLHAKRSTLSPYALAFLGLALDAAKDKRAADVGPLLESKAKTSDLEAWWEAAQDHLLDVDVDASPEATAYALKFLTHVKPDSPLLPKAALYLVNHRNQGYYWNSTKQTAMVIYGLTDFVARSGELKPDFAATVYVNDKAVLTKRFTAGEALLPAALHLSADQLAAGRNKIRITREGQGRLYWSARGGYYSQAAKLGNRGGRQLEVVREYFRMSPNKTGDKIVYDLEPVQGGAVKQGDLIAVKLTVHGDDWRYLMVEDPIPAGAELVERDDLYEFRAKPTWWEAWYTKRELRDDRAVFFQTWWSRGENRFTYLMKVVNPGEFRVSPTRVEPMYQPQYFAAGAASTLEVTR